MKSVTRGAVIPVTKCLPMLLAVILPVALAGCPRTPQDAPVAPMPVAQEPARAEPPAPSEPQPAATTEPARATAPATDTAQQAAPDAAEPAEPAAAAKPAPTTAAPAAKPAAKPKETAPQQAKSPSAQKPKPQIGKKWPIPEGPLNDDKYVAISAKYAAAVMTTPENDRTDEAMRTLLREVLKEARVSFDEYQQYTLKVAEDVERSEKVGKWIVQALADGGMVNLSGSGGVPGQDLKLRGIVEDDKKAR